MKQITLSRALDDLSAHKWPILAGGTDFYPALQNQAAPAQVLDLSQIEGLRYITETDDGWSIGAGATWTDIIRTSLPALFDALKAAAREVGSVQIQNAGTLAGNLCNASPAADGVPPLLSLNASVELASAGGRRIVQLREFIMGPRSTVLQNDELLIAIHVPRLDAGARSGFVKLGSRRYLVISIVMASVTMVPNADGTLSDVRIAVGACSAVAQRLSALEDALRDCSIHDDLASLVMPSMFDVLSPIDDVRGSGAYRLCVVRQLVCRLLSSVARDISVNLESNRAGQHESDSTDEHKFNLFFDDESGNDDSSNINKGGDS